MFTSQKTSPVTAALVVLALGFGGCGVANCAGVNHKPAVETARAYGQRMGLEVERIECARMDSDADGYVACSLKLAGERRPLTVECTGLLTLNYGCREPKATVR